MDTKHFCTALRNATLSHPKPSTPHAESTIRAQANQRLQTHRTSKAGEQQDTTKTTEYQQGKNQKLQTKEKGQQSPNQSVKDPSHQTCHQSCCSLRITT